MHNQGLKEPEGCHFGVPLCALKKRQNCRKCGQLSAFSKKVWASPFFEASKETEDQSRGTKKDLAVEAHRPSRTCFARCCGLPKTQPHFAARHSFYPEILRRPAIF